MSASAPLPATAPTAALHDGFLGLADDEEHRIEEGAIRGIVEVTKVQTADFAEYEKRKAAGKVIAEEVRGGFVYFAVTTDVDVPLGYANAWVFQTERFKAPLPPEP